METVVSLVTVCAMLGLDLNPVASLNENIHEFVGELQEVITVNQRRKYLHFAAPFLIGAAFGVASFSLIKWMKNK